MTEAPVTGAPVGIFGGTFDPIHVAHLAVAEAARDALGLERILFIPAGMPPHKSGRTISPAADRLAMVELAIAGNPAFATSSIEIERSGPSYTVDTLQALSVAGMELVLILSAEAFLGLRTWRDPEGVLTLAHMVVAPREGYPDADPSFLASAFPNAPARTTFLDGPRMRLSASELRARAAAGRSVRYLVPDAVAAYISDHGLYQDPQRIERT